MHTNDDPTGPSANSPFARIAELRIAAQQAQLDRARQLVERYRDVQDLDEMVQLQTELLAILDREDGYGHGDDIPAPMPTGSCTHISVDHGHHEGWGFTRSDGTGSSGSRGYSCCITRGTGR